MVKLKYSAIEGFVDQPNAEIVAVLLYGEDNGLVRERSMRLANGVVDDPSDPFRVAEISVAQLKDEPSRLFDEMALPVDERGAWLLSNGDIAPRWSGATANIGARSSMCCASSTGSRDRAASMRCLA